MARVARDVGGGCGEKAADRHKPRTVLADGGAIRGGRGEPSFRAHHSEIGGWWGGFDASDHQGDGAGACQGAAVSWPCIAPGPTASRAWSVHQQDRAVNQGTGWLSGKKLLRVQRDCDQGIGWHLPELSRVSLPRGSNRSRCEGTNA